MPKNRNKGGRPPKVIGKLTRSINLKLSEMDYVDLLTKAERLNLTPTAYARQMVVSGYVRAPYTEERVWIDGMTMNNGAKHNGFAKLSEDGTKIQISKRRISFTLEGVKLTTEQQLALDDGKAIFLSGLISQDNQVYDCYVKYSDDKQGCNFYRSNPDEPMQQQVQQQSQSQEHNQSGSVISGGLGLLDLPDDGGDDPDETQFRNRMQQQQKKKRGRKM